jgi:predicted nucleic acid-binding Zn ribbon protein
MLTERTCVVCGVSIEGHHFNAKTCSKSCAKRRNAEAMIRWKSENAERYRAMQRDWYAANRQRVLDQQKERIDKNPEARRRNQAAYRIRHQEKLRAEGRMKSMRARAALKLIHEIEAKGLEALL